MKLKPTPLEVAMAESRGERDARQKARRQRMAECKCLFGCDTCDPPPKGWNWNIDR